MSKKKILGITAAIITAGATVTSHIMKNHAKGETYKAEMIEPILARKMNFYEKYVKRALDIICASAAIV